MAVLFQQSSRVCVWDSNELWMGQRVFLADWLVARLQTLDEWISLTVGQLPVCLSTQNFLQACLQFITIYYTIPCAVNFYFVFNFFHGYNMPVGCWSGVHVSRGYTLPWSTPTQVLDVILGLDADIDIAWAAWNRRTNLEKCVVKIGIRSVMADFHHSLIPKWFVKHSRWP